MKKIISYLIAIVISITGLSSCAISNGTGAASYHQKMRKTNNKNKKATKHPNCKKVKKMVKKMYR